MARRARGVGGARSHHATAEAPDDIANGVLFFASDYAGWISGQVIRIDGGY